MLGVAACAAWWFWTATAAADAATTAETSGSQEVTTLELDLNALADLLGDGVVDPLLDSISPQLVEPVVEALEADVEAVDVLVESVTTQLGTIDTLIQGLAMGLTGEHAPQLAEADVAESVPLIPHDLAHSRGVELADHSAYQAPSVVGQIDGSVGGGVGVAVRIHRPGRGAGPDVNGASVSPRATTANAPIDSDRATHAGPSSGPRSTAPTSSGGGAERHERGPLFSAVIAGLAALAAAMTVRATPVVVGLLDGLGRRPPTTPD